MLYNLGGGSVELLTQIVRDTAAVVGVDKTCQGVRQSKRQGKQNM